MRQWIVSMAVLAALMGCESKEPPKPAGSSGGAASSGASGETKATPPVAVAKHPWGSFKKGSFTKMKSVTEMEIGGNKTKTEMTMTYTLKDLTADEAVLEMETVMANVPPQKSEQKMPLKAPEVKGAADAPKPKTGTEEIEVGGKKLKCNWTEIESDAGGMKMVTKVYTNEDVPGFTVKTVSKGPTMTSTMEAVEWSAK